MSILALTLFLLYESSIRVKAKDEIGKYGRITHFDNSILKNIPILNNFTEESFLCLDKKLIDFKVAKAITQLSRVNTLDLSPKPTNDIALIIYLMKKCDIKIFYVGGILSQEALKKLQREFPEIKIRRSFLDLQNF